MDRVKNSTNSRYDFPPNNQMFAGSSANAAKEFVESLDHFSREEILYALALTHGDSEAPTTYYASIKTTYESGLQQASKCTASNAQKEWQSNYISQIRQLICRRLCELSPDFDRNYQEALKDPDHILQWIHGQSASKETVCDINEQQVNYKKNLGGQDVESDDSDLLSDKAPHSRSNAHIASSDDDTTRSEHTYSRSNEDDSNWLSESHDWQEAIAAANSKLDPKLFNSLCKNLEKFGFNLPSNKLELDLDKALDFVCSHPSPKRDMNYDNLVQQMGELIRLGRLSADTVSPSYFQNVLMTAISAENHKMVKLLLKNGADISKKGILGKSVLTVLSDCMSGYTKIHQKHKDIYKMLVKSDQRRSGESRLKQLLADFPFDFVSTLIRENESRRPSPINFMKMTNVNFNQVNKENKTVLTIYMDRLDDKFIEDLVSYGADLNFQNSAGKTTLMYAVESKNNNFISYILKLGASVDVTDYQGLNAWHYAIKASAYKAFMTLLESDSFSRNPSSIDAPDCNGHSPIWHAINTDHPYLLNFLLKAGATFQPTTASGFNPWFAALESSNCDSMLATLACYDKSGKAINLRNEKNESIIDVARKKFSSNSSAESPIIDFLYSCGAAPERSEANVYKVIRENEKDLRTHIQRLIESRIDAHENYFNSIKTDIEKENIGSLPRGLRLTSQEIIKAYDKENAANIRYGGVTGDIYFQAYKQRIAIPSVAEFFASLKANPLIADRKNAAQFQPLALSILNVVFDVLGEIRQHIAKVSKTKDAEKFGQRIFHAYLHDPVLSYAAWREYMAVAFKEMIKNALTKSGNSRNPTWKDLLSQLQKAYGKDSVEITSEQDGELNFTFSVPHIGLSGSFTFHVIIDAPYNEKIDAKLIDRLFNEVQWGYSEFDPLTVSDTDASEQPPATLRFAKIDCEHAQYDITLASQMASSLANAILWDGKSLAEFQRMLYVLLRQVSVSSTFSRGQGAIVTILLESVARAHGLKLTWVEQLKPDSNRLHMTPDILALSGFDDAACLEEFKKNISLTRIQTDSESSGNSNSSIKKNKTTVEYH